jgi:hypothetical protein
VSTARLLQAYFAAKVLVSRVVTIIGPAFRDLRRESGNDRFDRAAHPGRRPCAKITLRNGARIIDKTWPADN